MGDWCEGSTIWSSRDIYFSDGKINNELFVKKKYTNLKTSNNVVNLILILRIPYRTTSSWKCNKLNKSK